MRKLLVMKEADIGVMLFEDREKGLESKQEGSFQKLKKARKQILPEVSGRSKALTTP